jgi:hypothetical protein
MKQVAIWALAGFVLALSLALPPVVWAVVGLFALAGVTALGVWALAMIVRGMIRTWRGERFKTSKNVGIIE